MRFVKPVDADLVAELAASHRLLVTVEENSALGGAGSAVAEALAARAIVSPFLPLGLPDRFVDHGDQAQLLASVGLDRSGIVAAIRARLA
jgi:1-deoxy-D-xylulose-5-phosphate synthase